MRVDEGQGGRNVRLDVRAPAGGTIGSRAHRLWIEGVAVAEPGETVISRVVRILEAFDTEATLSTSELARRTDLPVPTVHRLVVELTRWGLLERAANRRVRVGLRLWELGRRASSELSLRDRALPYMEDLQDVVRHHTQLSVLDGTDIIYLERLSARSSAVNITRIAGRLPAASSSAGLILAAHATPELRTMIVNRPLTRYTPNTVVDAGELESIIARARDDGYVVTNGWIHVDSTGISVPVRGGAGEVLAALTVIVPSKSTLVRTALPAVLTASRGITRALRQAPRTNEDLRLRALEAHFRRRDKGVPPPH